MSPKTTAETNDEAALAPSEPVLWHLALLSGADGTTLHAGLARLKARFAQFPVLEDVPVRIRTVGSEGGHRGAVLTGEGVATDLGVREAGHAAPVAFMFPGLGDHYVDMGRDLYRDFPVFRAAVDECAKTLTPELGLDIREIVFPDPEPGATVTAAPAVDLRRMLGRGDGPRSENERRLRTPPGSPSPHCSSSSTRWPGSGSPGAPAPPS